MYDPNLFAVDTTGVEAMGGYEVLPAGLYPVVMLTAQKKPNSKNNGAFIECVYQIIDGDCAGKKYTSRMNLWNENVQAVDIAKRELKSLRLALGLPDTVADPAQFVNKPVVLNIGVKPRKDAPSKAENNLIAIEPYNGAPAQQAPAPQTYVAPQQTQPQAQHQPGGWGHPAPAPAPQPQQPAFQPNTAKPMPWMVGAR